MGDIPVRVSGFTSTTSRGRRYSEVPDVRLLLQHQDFENRSQYNPSRRDHELPEKVGRGTSTEAGGFLQEVFPVGASFVI